MPTYKVDAMVKGVRSNHTIWGRNEDDVSMIALFSGLFIYSIEDLNIPDLLPVEMPDDPDPDYPYDCDDTGASD